MATRKAFTADSQVKIQRKPGMARQERGVSIPDERGVMMGEEVNLKIVNRDRAGVGMIRHVGTRKSHG